MNKQWVLATGNKGKVKEMSELLNSFSIEVLPQSHFDVSEVPETGTTFVENAIIKARHAAKITGLPAIADEVRKVSSLEHFSLQSGISRISNPVALVKLWYTNAFGI